MGETKPTGSIEGEKSSVDSARENSPAIAVQDVQRPVIAGSLSVLSLHQVKYSF